MESANLNPAPNDRDATDHNEADEAQLGARLREALPPLRDDGFSSRVLAALPLPAVKPNPWARLALCVVGAVIGSGYAWWRGVAWSDLSATLHQVAAPIADTSSSLASPMLLAGLLTAGLSLLFAFRTELRRRFF